MAAQTVSLKLLIQATNNASKEVVKLKDQLNELSQGAIKLGQDTAKGANQGKQGVDGLTSSTAKFAKSAEAAKKATEGFGKAGVALLGVATALAGATFFPVKGAADFEQALSGVIAVTSGAEGALESLKETASELGRTTKFTATEAAVGMQFLGQAGFDAGEVITGIGPSLQLAVAAAVDLGSAANIATNVLSGMRLPVTDLQQVVDVLAKTAAESNAELLDMAEALSYAGPIASAAGVGINDLASIVGVLGNAGIQGSRAGTALRGTLFALTDPAGQAKDTLDELGVSIKTGADGSIDLIDAFHQLADANLDVADAQQIFGRFASAGVLAITSQIDALDEMVISNNAAAGAAQKMADIMKDNLKGAITELFSAVNGLRRAFGDPLIGTFRKAVELTTKMVGGFTKLADTFPVSIRLLGTLALAIAAVSAALGVLALGIAGVTSAMSQLSFGLVRMTDLFSSIKIAVLKLGGAMTVAKTQMGAYAMTANVATGATWSFRVALNKLKVAILATGIPGLVAAITAALATTILVLQEYEESLKRAASESGTAAIQFDGLRTSYIKQVEALKEMEEGSEKATATGKNMRKELLELAKNNKELAKEALAAAYSINEMTGSIGDGGEAINAFIERSRELAELNLAKQMDLVNDSLDRQQNKLFDLVGVWQKIKLASDLAISNMLPGGKSVVSIFEDQAKAIEEAKIQVEGVNRAYVSLLQKQGELDSSLSLDSLIRYFIIIKGISEERAITLANLTKEMQREASLTKDIVGTVEKLSVEELKADIAGVTEEINTLDESYKSLTEDVETVGKALEEAHREGAISAETLKKELGDLFKDQAEARKKLGETEEKQNQYILGLRKKLREDLKIQYDGELKDYERQKELSIITDIEYQKKVLELNIKRSEKEVENALTLQTEILKINKDTAKKLSVTDTIGTDIAKANAKRLDNIQKAADLEVKLTNEKNKIIKGLEDEAASIRVDLMEEGPKKFKEQMDEEIRLLKKANLEKGIEEDELGVIISAIRAKYRKQEEGFLEEEKKKQDKLDDEKIKEAERKAQDKAKKEQDLEKSIRQARLGALGEDDQAAKNQLEIDALKTLNEQKLAEFVKLTDDELVIAQYKADLEVALERKKKEEIQRIQEEQKKFMMKGLSDTLAASVHFYGKQSKLSKTAFALQKMVAIRETIISTYKGAQDAFTSLSGIPYIGTVLGIAAAAAAIAAGMARVAQIRSQSLAEGGEVKGKSPNSKADNIPIMATANEFMQPVSAVKYYGRDIMEAMRRKLIPREVFRELPVPIYIKSPSPRYAYAGGGQVTPGNGASMGMGGQAAAAPPAQEIKIMNYVDQREMISALGSPEGEDVVLNVISRNKDKVSRVLR